MINSRPEGGTQFDVCAVGDEASESVSRIRLIMPPPLKGVTHRCRDEPRLSKMSEITARALPGDTSWTKCGPVVRVRRIADGDAPRRHFSQNRRRITNADVENIVLRRIGAVDVVH